MIGQIVTSKEEAFWVTELQDIEAALFSEEVLPMAADGVAQSALLQNTLICLIAIVHARLPQPLGPVVVRADEPAGIEVRTSRAKRIPFGKAEILRRVKYANGQTT
jgi:hypothetical protein